MNSERVSFVIRTVPRSLNRWSREHWSVRQKAARDWKLIIRAACPRRSLFTVPVRVDVSVCGAGDADNYAKFVLDGLVGVLVVDDRWPYIAERVLRDRPAPVKERRIEVVVEPMPEATDGTPQETARRVHA